MKNLLQIATDKKTKLQSLKSVKLTAVKNENTIVLSGNGTIVPESEVISFSDGYVNVSGLFAANFSCKEAIHLNKI